MSKRKIWIDVTDFLKWQGNFTGFQHIQYNMAKQYIASGQDVSFFVYDQPARAFKQVDFDPDTVASDGIIAAETMVPAPSRPLLATMKRYAPVRLKRVIKRMLKGSTTPSVRPIVKTTHSPFRTGDVVMILGGIWHGTFADDIVAEKQRHGFTFIHIVHDMIPVQCPQCVVEDLPGVFSAYNEKVLAAADGLIINSQSSRRDVLAFMKKHHITPPPSVVFRIADEPIENKKGTPIKQVTGKKFIASIGTIEGRKNHMLLYYAYKQAIRNDIQLPTLVIAGRRGWLVDDFLYMATHDPDVKDKIVICNNITNSERAWLYEHCLFTIWPSFYEGWGMPVAEAAAYGKLCLSSDVSSMPEITGNLNEYFSPYSVDECLRLIQKYLDPKVRDAKEKALKKGYKPTTWHDMYETINNFVSSL